MLHLGPRDVDLLTVEEFGHLVVYLERQQSEAKAETARVRAASVKGGAGRG